jgi:hypothetical protein
MLPPWLSMGCPVWRNPSLNAFSSVFQLNPSNRAAIFELPSLLSYRAAYWPRARHFQEEPVGEDAQT